jgi:hypothetical protein
MRSIRVPLELTVRLVSAVKGVENTNASKPFKKFGERMQTPPAVLLSTACCIHLSAKEANASFNAFNLCTRCSSCV